MFAKKVPQFNFEGREKIHTQIGVIASMFVYLCVFAYGCIKGIELMNLQNPSVHKFTKYDMFAKEKEGLLPLNAEDGMQMKIAFAVKKSGSDEYYDDPKYVQWLAAFVEGNNSGDEKRTHIGVHQCQ
jgi:hypothetical protein